MGFEVPGDPATPSSRAGSAAAGESPTPSAGPLPIVGQDGPSLDLAFEQGIRSYAEVATRLNVVHSRLDSIQSVVITLTVAVPTVAVAADRDPDFASGWVIAAIVLGGTAVLLGLWARAWSGLILINPADLQKHAMHYSPADFKRDALHWAGENFETNSRIVTRKSRVATLMSVLLFGETALFIVWLAST